MRHFPSPGHLAAWAGLAPGNNESGGRQRSRRTRKGNCRLCAALVQAMQSAAHTKQTFCSAQYHRIAAQRGKKKAIVAVAQTLLAIAYHVIAHQHPVTTANRLVKRLRGLGYTVQLEVPPPTEPKEVAAPATG